MRLLGSKADKKKFLLLCGISPLKNKESLVFDFINSRVQQICLRDLESNECSLSDFIGPDQETLNKVISIVSKYYNVRSSSVVFQELKQAFVKEHKDTLIQGIEEYLEANRTLSQEELLETIEIGFYQKIISYYYSKCQENAPNLNVLRVKTFTLKTIFPKVFKTNLITCYGWMSNNTIKYSKLINNFEEGIENGTITKELIIEVFNTWLNPNIETLSHFSEEENRALQFCRENSQYYIDWIESTL